MLGGERFFFADDAQRFVEGGGAQALAIERGFAADKFVEQHAQGINVGAGVDVELVELGLLGAHVFDRADHLAEFGEHGLFGQALTDSFGDAEVDDFDYGTLVVIGHQNVRGLKIAMDNSLLMGVLHRLADLDEQFQALARGSRCSSQYWMIETPLTNSMTK